MQAIHPTVGASARLGLVSFPPPDTQRQCCSRPCRHPSHTSIELPRNGRRAACVPALSRTGPPAGSSTPACESPSPSPGFHTSSTLTLCGVAGDPDAPKVSGVMLLSCMANGMHPVTPPPSPDQSMKRPPSPREREGRRSRPRRHPPATWRRRPARWRGRQPRRVACLVVFASRRSRSPPAGRGQGGAAAPRWAVGVGLGLR